MRVDVMLDRPKLEDVWKFQADVTPKFLAEHCAQATKKGRCYTKVRHGMENTTCVPNDDCTNAFSAYIDMRGHPGLVRKAGTIFPVKYE